MDENLKYLGMVEAGFDWEQLCCFQAFLLGGLSQVVAPEKWREIVKDAAEYIKANS